VQILFLFPRNYVYYKVVGIYIRSRIAGFLLKNYKLIVNNEIYVPSVHSLIARFFLHLKDDKKHKGFAVQIPCSAVRSRSHGLGISPSYAKEGT